MKKYFYLFLAFIATITFAACSDDDPKAPDFSDVIEKEIVGNYGGFLKINVDGTDLATVPQGISIKKGAGENTISLSIADFSFIGIELGDINLDNCAFSGKDGSYTFTSDEPLTLTADGGFTAIVNLKNANIVNEEISFDLDIDATVGAMKQKVKVSYTGKRGEAVKSNEAKVLSFTFDKDFETHPMHKVLLASEAVVDEAAKTITIEIDGNLLEEEGYAEALKNLHPVIEVSESATYSPTEGFDFSNAEAPVKITVTAEDGITTAEYTVVVSKVDIVKYDFETWTKDTSNKDENLQYPIAEGWASCNPALVMIKSLGSMAKPEINYTGGWPVASVEDVKSGSLAAIMESVDTQGPSKLFGQPVPKVTAGTLFLGKFDTFAALGGALKSTKFGVMYSRKPLTVSGYYKYTPGTEFYDKDGKLVSDRKDECSMSAVLYEVENEKETLDGTNIYTSDKIVAQKMFKTGETVSEFTEFNLELEYIKEYDPAKKYKFAIIFSASADGAAYNAAVGSKLIIDDVTVVNE